MDAVLEIMDQAGETGQTEKLPAASRLREQSLTLAVARDEAFCFYYEENLRTIEDAGIRIKYFSPLYDSKVPGEADGLLFGGGYPEL